MLPSQFKRLIETLRSQLESVREALKEQERTSRDAAKTAEKKWAEIPGIVASNILGTTQDKESDEAHKQKSEGQQDSLIRSQNKLVFWTRLAFLAAAIYAGIAAVQGCLMNLTYREMRNQTMASVRSAYMACLSAQAAQNNLRELQQSTQDAHSVAIASVEQAFVNLKAQRAMMNFIPNLPNVTQLVGDNLSIPYSLVNQGNSEAVSFSLKFRAEYLKEGERLKIDEKPSLAWANKIGKDIAPGTEYPPKSQDPLTKYVFPAVLVLDSKGNTIPVRSMETVNLLHGEGGEVFVYGNMV